jgi:hypothetical protein
MENFILAVIRGSLFKLLSLMQLQSEFRNLEQMRTLFG